MKNIKEVKFELEGLTCADCAGKIERALQKDPRFDDARVDVVMGTAKVNVDEAVVVDDEFVAYVSNQIQAIEDVGVSLAGKKKAHDHDHPHDHDHGDVSLSPFILLGVGLIGLRLFVEATWLNVLTIVVYVIVGWPVLTSFLKGLKRKQFFDENVLMSVATIGAMLIGEYGEGLGVMVFYSIGEYFQHKAVSDSRASIKALLDKQPSFARKLVNGDAQIVECDTVNVGDRILVNPTDQVPLDGRIVKGTTTLDMASLTGESLPVNVMTDDEIMSGSINLTSPIEVEVTKPYSNSTISKMLRLIEESSDKKAKTEIFMTKFSRMYTPIVFALAVLIMVTVGLTTGVAYEGIYRGLVFLVISCPCALVLSVPLGYFAGIGRASKEGILIKGGDTLEALADVKGFVFDKTGTLTEGKLAVDSIKGDANVLTIAAHVEHFSNHPIALAIVEAYGQTIDTSRVTDVKEMFGKGIEAKYNGEFVFVGSVNNVKALGYDVKDYQSDLTSVLVVKGNEVLGAIYLVDQRRTESDALIAALHQRHLVTAMLSGDRQGVVDRVAHEMGIDYAFGELLPEDKVTQFEAFRAQHNKKIAYVGDGMNDAAVLGLSDVGFSMGTVGNDLAIEYSDIVLVNDNPLQIIEALEIAKKTQRITMMNILLIIVVKVLVLVLGSLGLASMWMAVLADVGISILAVLNAMRILKMRTHLPVL